MKTNNSKGYDIALEGDYINVGYPKSKKRRGRVGHGVSQTLNTSSQEHCVVAAAMRGRPDENGKYIQQIEISEREVANSFTTAQKDSLVSENLRIRKLTPKECFRLMGFNDEEFDSIQGVSNTQLYKQAGNSIVVDVLVALFAQLFKTKILDVDYQCQDEEPQKDMVENRLLEAGYIKKSENGTKHQSNTVYDDRGIFRGLNAGDWKSFPMVKLTNEKERKNESPRFIEGTLFD